MRAASATLAQIADDSNRAPVNTTDQWLVAGLHDGITRDNGVGSECGHVGTCTLDLDWLMPCTVAHHCRAA
jgi:hypothetical protein